MTSKLGLHVLPGPANVDSLIQSAGWAAVKEVNGTRRLAVAAASGIAIRILRDTETDALPAATAAARLLSYDLSPVTALQLCCESTRGDDPVWQAAVIAAVRAGGFSGVCLVGGFATGNPTKIVLDAAGNEHFPELEPLYPLLRTPGVALALDQYSGILPTDPRWASWAPYTCQRHRLILADLARNGIDCVAYCCESGGDNASPVTSGGGWTTRGWSLAAYSGLLTTLDTADQQDARLACRCVFTVAPTPDWAAYDLSPLGGMLADWLATANAAGNGPQQAQDGRSGLPATKEASLTTAGVDLSNVNGAVDMAQVATVARFVCLKLCEGVGWRDPTFTANWDAAGAAGLVRCAYAFARPDLQNTPEAEAGYFVRQLPPLAVGDSVALDLEVGTGDLSGWALRWLQAAQNAVGFAPWLYSYRDFIATRSLGTVALAAYPLWYASYQASEPAPPGQWRQIAVWQATDAASVPGVGGAVDGDVTDLTVAQLKALGKPAPVVEAPTVDEALTYYQQLGIKIDPTHAVYTVALKPLYDYWKAHQGDTLDGAVIGDLIKPGPAVLPEFGTLWGSGRPAACVKLQNCVVGAYLATDGTWRPYRASI